MKYENREHFIEELNKSIKADIDSRKEELNKAARNNGSGGNDASGKTPLRIAWAKKAKHLEGEVDRLSTMAEGKSEDHRIHSTLKRAQSELDTHYDNHPG